MSRYIDAENILYSSVMVEEDNGNYRKMWIATKEDIDAIPTADIRENVKGEWGRTKNGFIYCSNCEATWYDNAWTDDWHYCPNCGADMRGEA